MRINIVTLVKNFEKEFSKQVKLKRKKNVKIHIFLGKIAMIYGRFSWRRDTWFLGKEKCRWFLFISLVAGAHNAEMARKCRELYFGPKNDLQLLPVSEESRKLLGNELQINSEHLHFPPPPPNTLLLLRAPTHRPPSGNWCHFVI